VWLPVASGAGRIEKTPLPWRWNLVASHLVVALARSRSTSCGNRVRCRRNASYRLAPARVGGVQGIARIGERHDQLRSANFFRSLHRHWIVSTFLVGGSGNR